MPDDPRPPRPPAPPAPPAGMTFEHFTETSLNAIFRAARVNGVLHGPITIGVVVGPGTYGGHQISCGFAAVVKPFFTDCYRQHMMFMFDLYDKGQVQANWQAIHDAVANGSMPSPGCPGTFNQSGFLQAFQCWKDQGFPA